MSRNVDSYSHIFVLSTTYFFKIYYSATKRFLLQFQAGRPWFSILTRTGVFKGKENSSEFPADLVNIP